MDEWKKRNRKKTKPCYTACNLYGKHLWMCSIDKSCVRLSFFLSTYCCLFFTQTHFSKRRNKRRDKHFSVELISCRNQKYNALNEHSRATVRLQRKRKFAVTIDYRYRVTVTHSAHMHIFGVVKGFDVSTKCHHNVHAFQWVRSNLSRTFWFIIVVFDDFGYVTVKFGRHSFWDGHKFNSVFFLKLYLRTHTN